MMIDEMTTRHGASRNKGNPTAAMLVIGNEILSGRTQDANINFLARKLGDQGIDLLEVRVVRDREEAIVDALNALRHGYDTVFTSGGIGPTHDDITMPCVAKALDVPLERHAETAEKLKNRVGARVTEATYRMADFPAGAHLVPNGETTAPGCIAANIVVCAGIPKIFQVMVEASLPRLAQGQPVYSKSLDIWLTESQIAAGLEKIQSHFPQLDIGSYPYRVDGRHGTALLARGTDAGAVESAYEAIRILVDELGGELRQR